MKTEQKPAGQDDGRLYRIAQAGNVQQIETGTWAKEELDWRDGQGRTALMCAALRGDHKTALALKLAGADVTLTDPDGRKAVHLAALHGHGTVLVCLIEGGCGG